MKRFIVIAAAAMLMVGCGVKTTDAQECIECQAQAVIVPVTKRVPVTTMETRTITKPVMTYVQEEIQIPVTRCVETTEYHQVSPVAVRKVRAPNWGCIATGLRAYANCAYAKRSARRAARAARRTVAVVMPPTGC